MSESGRLPDPAAPLPDLPGPPPPLPDLAAVEASIDPVPVTTAIPPGAPLVPEAATPSAIPTTAPAESEMVGWQPIRPRRTRPVLARWALGLAIAALLASLLVGWMLPLGLVAIVLGVVSARRPGENRAFAVWAIVLGAASALYSAGWLLWAAWQLGVVG
ncbi:hypothetical protein [Microbacterium sp. P05]|uniref:hypothetical protein n=1 Tax=Microbacterium sp. P05 TaxID=3366948 RepID=UPI003746C17D